MKKLAYVFAGQGSQFTGMGLDFLTKNSNLIQLEEKADAILGYHTRDILLSDDGRVNQTVYTQPLVLLSSIYAYESLHQLGIKPEGVLGFSLGEYTALYAAEVFTFDEIMNLIKMRSRWMHEASLEHQGAMAAVLGLAPETVDQICDQLNEQIFPANYNSPTQTVISGAHDMIEEAMSRMRQAGAKRVMKLNVSGAFHSPWMMSAGKKFGSYIKDMRLHNPQCEVILNTTAEPLIIDELKNEMIKQISSPVRFMQAILNMKQKGYTHFIEIGPGTVLSGLIKKIDETLEVTHLERITDLDRVKGWLKEHGFIE